MTLRMWLMLVVVVCLHLASVQAARKIPKRKPCPLCDFVYHDDGAFSFQLTDQYDLSNVSHLNIPVQTYVFNMTSGKYFEGGVDEPLWWHTLIINVPVDLQYTKTVFLMLSGLMLHQRVDENDKDLIGTARMAAKTKSITAAVYHIPRDTITFLSDPNMAAMDSDRAMLFTILAFYQTLDPNILLYLPMTKVAAKAMDVIQNPGIPGYPRCISKFVIGGESKRGWVTWLVSGIDDRVEAIIPVTASNFMKIDENVHLLFQSYGGYSFFHAPQLYSGMFSHTDTNESRQVSEIIDPLSYAKYLDMPKLVIVSASDDIFIPEATKLWFNKMPGDNKLWLLENRGHFLELYPNYNEFWEGMGSFFASIVLKYARPCVSWKVVVSDTRNTGTIKMFTDHIPKSVKAFYTSSVVPNRRDFRTIIWCPSCTPIRMCGTCPPLPIEFTGIHWTEDTASVVKKRDKVFGTLYRYKVTYDFPPTGYLGFFMQMVFEGPDGTDMTYTSEINILPNTYPSPDCVGAACGDLSIPIV